MIEKIRITHPPTELGEESGRREIGEWKEG
jgi:hypothetical protein